MPKFLYKVKNVTGQTLRGKIESSDTRTASSALRGQGYFIIDIKVDTPPVILSFLSLFRKGIGLTQLTDFTRQMSVMISTGLTISESLAILRNQTSSPELEKVIGSLIVEVEEGASFSKALSHHPNVFPDIYVAVVKAGEASGVLDKLLNKLAENLEQERDFKGKTQGALLYPLIVLIAMAGVVSIIMLFFIPQLSTLYEQLNIELPLITKIVVVMSNIFVSFWYIIFGVIGGGTIFFLSWKKTPQGKKVMDILSLKLPVFGTLQKDINYTEITRTFGLLSSSGTPIIDALTSVGNATRNSLFADAVMRAAKKVEKGLTLAVAFSQEPILPPLIAQMARVGEETGKINEVMTKISLFYEAEAERRVKALTTLLEPIILLVLAIGVGFLLVAIIMPIYGLTSAF